jgi:DNA helicase INO80
MLFIALKKKIRIEDLLHYTVGGGDTASNDKNFTSNLMNLVMQFRKVSLYINLLMYLVLL